MPQSGRRVTLKKLGGTPWQRNANKEVKRKKKKKIRITQEWDLKYKGEREGGGYKLQTGRAMNKTQVLLVIRI